MANAPVPSPRTFNVQEYETAAYLNSVRDAINFLLNRPVAFLTQGTVQSLPSSAWAAVTYDQSGVDTYGGHSNTTNPSRYTAQVAGWYSVGGGASTAANATGQRGAAVARNGTRVQGGAAMSQAASALSPTVPTPPTLAYLNVGDYLEIDAYQNSGGALNTASSSDLDSSMAVVWEHA